VEIYETLEYSRVKAATVSPCICGVKYVRLRDANNHH
jgi:hypothetical protein